MVTISCNLAFGGRKTYEVHHEFTTVLGELAAEVRGTYGLLDLAQRQLVADPVGTWSRFTDRPEALGLPVSVGEEPAAD